MTIIRLTSLLLFAVIVAPAKAGATFTAYTDKAQWQAVAGPSTKIDFLGFPEFTIITDQYAEQGITFTDGNDYIFTTASFPSDGAGLVSAANVLVPESGTYMHFDQPRNAIAVDYIGHVKFQLFFHDQLIYDSNEFSTFFHFAGFTSTMPFDGVLVWDSTDAVVAIDNLYFGGPVPAPTGAVIMIAGLAAGQKRRRRS